MSTPIDASASSSDATQQGNQVGTGTWNVGGGIKVPPWLIAVAVAGVVIVLIKFFDRPKRK